MTAGGSGYITAGGIKKFTDPLPGLCVPPACPTTGKYIPLAVPEVKTYNGVEADEYVIGLVQYRTSFSSSLPPTLVRGYVQLETPANAGISQHFPLTNELLDGTQVPVMRATAYPVLAVTPPQWLGPTIVATKDRPVRIVFHNLLPTGTDGDLFLPVDTTPDGLGHGPDGHGGPGGRRHRHGRGPQPDCAPSTRKDPTHDAASRTTGPPCTCTAASPPGSATARRTSGSPRPDEMTAWPQGVSVAERARHGRRATPPTTAARPSTTPTSRAPG